MRREAPDDDDLLEPLPVFVDGVAVAPVHAWCETRVAAAPPHNERNDATAAPVHAALAVRALPAWSGSAPTVVPPVHGASRLGAFSRMIALRADLLDSLPDWWRRRARDDRVEIARRLLLERPRRGPAGTWRMRGSLRSPGRLRSIPLELLLWPRFATWTKLRVEPRRAVHVDRRYFRNGHQAIDALCVALIHELGATAPLPVVDLDDLSGRVRDVVA